MLAHERLGEGPSLVLVHGVGLNRSAWRPVLEPLARRRDVIAIDLPGHGESPPMRSDLQYDVAGYVTAVRELVDALQLDRPHIAGNSLGGAVALELARLGAVRSATALSPIGFWTPGEIRFAMASLRLSRVLARALLPASPFLLRSAWVRFATFAQYYGHPARLTTEEALNAAQNFARSTALPLTLPRTRNYRFLPEPLPTVPVTIGWGTRDRLLLPRQAKRARELLPDAHHAWLPGSGHVPMSDDPERIVDLILASEGPQEKPG